MGACARADGINIPPTRNLGPAPQPPLRVEAAHNKEVKLQCKDGGRGQHKGWATETRKLFRSVLGTLLCPSAVSLGIGAAQPAESLAARRSIMSATFDYLRSSAAGRETRAAIHV